jgi:hypothetical protein
VSDGRKKPWKYIKKENGSYKRKEKGKKDKE